MGNMANYIVRGINKAGSISAIGTPNMSTILSCIIFPQVQTDLQGGVLEIVGNMSNVQGEFSLINMRVVTLCHFTVIGKRGDLPSVQVDPENMENKYLNDTNWKRRQHCISCDVNLDPILP